ncbi:hypothetical protein [Streptomyces sp. NPDC058657]|uniref:hypothetical protein n=1 Tax=unclassified Streptomyces TaxID=2593676 RepID=UPI0036577D07
MLQGHYPAAERLIELEDGSELNTVDVLGLGAPLFRHVSDQDPHSMGSRFVQATQEWFDCVRDLLAQ